MRKMEVTRATMERDRMLDWKFEGKCAVEFWCFSGDEDDERRFLSFVDPYAVVFVRESMRTKPSQTDRTILAFEGGHELAVEGKASHVMAILLGAIHRVGDCTFEELIERTV